MTGFRHVFVWMSSEMSCVRLCHAYVKSCWTLLWHISSYMPCIYEEIRFHFMTLVENLGHAWCVHGPTITKLASWLNLSIVRDPLFFLIV